MIGIFAFIFIMWALMLLGGAAAVIVIDSISISGYDSFDFAFTSAAKAAVVILLISAWVFSLSMIKNRMFQKKAQS